MNDNAQIKKLIIAVVEDQKQEFALDFEISQDMSFIGDNSVFDSIELISFITELESTFETAYKHEFSLVNETAFSFTDSPFLSLNTLIDHIAKLI